MANKKTHTVRVLHKFVDKYTNELHAAGTTFEADEKRIAEINKGRKTPLVEIMTGDSVPQKPAENADDAPDAPEKPEEGEKEP